MADRNTIATAYVQIKPSMEGVQGELSQAFGEEGVTAGSAFGGKFATALKVASGAATIAFDATSKAVSGLVDGVSDLAAYGDNIDKMSQKMGISAESYQEWEAVMQHSGTSMETMKSSMKTLANAAETGNEAFELLGMSLEDIGNMSQQDLFETTIARLQEVEDTTQRTYISGKLLGRGATELGALLNTSAEETQAMRDRVRELGGVMNEDAVKAAAAFQDSLQDMQTGFDGMKRNLLKDFLPSMTKVMDGLGDIFAGDATKGIEQMQQGIVDTVGNVANLIPKFMKIAGPIIKAIGQALIENAPTLLPAVAQLVGDIGQGIIDSLPELATAAIQILSTLATGLSESLPTLIPSVVEAVMTIAEGLLDNIDLVIDAAIQLIIGLAEGLINALPVLIEKIPVIVEKLVNALIENAPKLLEAAAQLIGKLVEGIFINLPGLLAAAGEIIVTIVAGIFDFQFKLDEAISNIIQMITDAFTGLADAAISWGADMIEGFIDGIGSMAQKLWDSVCDIADGIAKFLGFSEPEKGPLSNFHTYAPDMMELFAKGIRDNEKLVTAQIEHSFDFGGKIKEQEALRTAVQDTPVYSMNAAELQVDNRETGELNDQFGEAVKLLGKLVDKEPVELSANIDGIFDLMRRKDGVYFKANGRSAFA